MTDGGDHLAVQGLPSGRDRRGRKATDADGPNPAVQGRRLRTALRQARQAAGLTLEQVAAELDVSPSKIVRIESGAVKVSTSDLKALLDLYKITDPREVTELVAMARAARQRPWWQKAYGEVASHRYLEYVELEQAAAMTLNFEPLVVPGLLQTAEYAHAVIRRSWSDASDDQVNSLVEFRLDRQKRLLDAPDPPNLSFVLDVSVIYRRVGGAEVMKEQVRHLITLAGRPNITLQFLPFDAGLGPSVEAPFVIIQFPDAADPDVLYRESPSGSTLTNDQAEVARYRTAFEELRRMSLSGPDSLKFLQELLSGSR